MKADKYLIFDLETEIHKSHKRTANPFDPRNRVVARGWKKEGDEVCSWSYLRAGDTDTGIMIADDVGVIVGHNIKFDLLYEMTVNDPNLRAFFKRGGRIWCTQYAEYLLNAMDRKFHMNSMDQIIESYGGRKKIDGMKELWKAGVQTSEIDPAMVEDYLIGTADENRNSGDIGNTELIYLGQIEAAEELGMMKSIQVRMDGLAATTEMEYNGIKVDVKAAAEDLKELQAELAEVTAELDTYVSDIPDEVGFSWGSLVHKSCIIYGGTIRYQKQDTYIDEKTGQLARLVATERQPVMDDSGEPVFYKSGKKKGEQKFKNVRVPGELKVKYQDSFYELPGYIKAADFEIAKTAQKDGKDGPIYSTDGDTIALLGNTGIGFLEAMSKKGALDKEIGTYYVTRDKSGELKGMLTCVDPSDHIIHHALNHTSTVTSRLSASNPNMQNIPRGDKSKIKRMFVSRFANGVMAEIDYSQLEVVVMGLLSGDKKLEADLNNKVDFHCVRVAAREGCSYKEALLWCKDQSHEKYPVWTVYRTECKIFSFQRAYGAGASTIALSANMSVDQVKEMIKVEEAMYPGVEKFHAAVEAEINATAEAFRDPERGYRVFRKGTWQAPTGTMYKWRSWDAPKFMRDRGVTDTFSPPEIKNYPTQGTGGEIVQMVLGVLWRLFIKTDNFDGRCLLVNTVHDCVWFDMQADAVDEVLPRLVRVMEGVPILLKHFFDMDCKVPFPVDAEVGPNMLELSHP